MMPQRSIEERLVAILKVRKALVATVESCTGGLIATRFTNIANSSHVFWGAWVAYQNSAKVSLLGLDPERLRKDGAVSETTARLLAEAGLERLVQSVPEADLHLCLATTGVAGPKSGEKGELPGTCYIALASSGHKTQTLILKPGPDTPSRETLKQQFADSALTLLESALAL